MEESQGILRRWKGWGYSHAQLEVSHRVIWIGTSIQPGILQARFMGYKLGTLHHYCHIWY